MTDLLGPGDAGASPVLTTTTDVSNPNAADTFFQNCTPGVANSGTPLNQKWLNRLLQQVRRIVRASGVALNNANDDMLGQAIQTGYFDWVGTVGGNSSLWTATFSPVPPTLVAGMRIKFVVAYANPGAISIVCNGGATIAMTRSDGVAFVGGEFAAGQTGEALFDGVAWRCASLPAGSGSKGRLINTQYFSSTATYTPTPGTKTVVYDLNGGGGGGAGTAAPSSSQVGIGGSGNGGARTVGSCAVATISGLTVTIGAAGAGGAAGQNAGGAGGTTSIGTVATAPGGNGGAAHPVYGSVIDTPAMGSIGTGGNILATGGQLAQVSEAVFASGLWFTGQGGSSPYGDGGGARSGGTTGNAGLAADGYAAGGSGGCAYPGYGAQPGANGSPGFGILYEYA